MRRHGTFISTIVAGNYVDNVSRFGYGGGTSSGIEPCKVIWDDDNTYASNIVAAILFYHH